MKSHKHLDHAFAIVRVDEFLGDAPTEQKVTVKLVMWDAEEAQREAARLNALQKDGSAHYFVQTTRIEPGNKNG